MENSSIGNFCGSVLLSEDVWDKEQLLCDLREEWGIVIPEEDADKETDSIIGEVNGCRIVVSKFPSPVPNQEAEMNAKNNFMWKEAVEVTSTHKAHIVVAVLGEETSLTDRGMIYTKIMAACTKQKYAIGVFTSGVVFEPNHYYNAAQSMKEDILPIVNWIWFGIYTTEHGVSGYTYGMDVFGKLELEVLDANAAPAQVYDFLVSLVSYILEQDVVLQDGETIGFSENDIHEITLSKGVSLPEQDTLKVSYESRSEKVSVAVNQDRIDVFRAIYPCPYEVVASREVNVLSEKYLHSLEKGKTEGFTPVYIVLDDTLLEKFEIEMDDAGVKASRELFDIYVQRAQDVNVEAFFQDKNDAQEDFEEDSIDTSVKHTLELLTTFEDGEADLLLVQVPTTKPYELLSYFPMGGFNDCPMPEVQTAVSKKWYEEYGAIPAVISYCEAEYYVQNPPRDIDTAKKLACEQYAFCADIVEQGMGDIQNLISHVFDNVQWYFWWD